MKLYSNEEDIILLQDVLKKAGDISLQYFKKTVKMWLKDDKSPVSESDIAVNKFLYDNLMTARPNYGWISEESDVFIKKGEHTERTFVVDPIDGTRGFLKHDPHWCISVAISQGDKIVSGAIYCPVLGELYHSVLHGGVYKNGSLIDEYVIKKDKCVVSIPTQIIDDVKDKVPDDIVLYPYVPSLAYKIILCVIGVVDIVVIRPSCKIWDIAAADLMLRSSGGCLVDYDGNKISYDKPEYHTKYLFAYKNIEQFKDLAIELKDIIS